MVFENDRYSIRGIDVHELAQMYGTPLYVYDGEKIVEQYHALKNAFSGVDVRIKYASKALTNISIVKLLKSVGAGFDAVSINEVKLGLKLGYEAKDIIFTPNCVDLDEIYEAAELGVVLNLDSLYYIEAIGLKYGSSYPICIRLNPHVKAGGNENIQVGHIRSKFGISMSYQQRIIDVVQKYNIDVAGVHIHTGSDITDIDSFLQGANALFSFAQHFTNLRFIDFGSGFKVAYKQGDKVTDIELLGLRLREAFTDFCKRYGRDLQLWLEPGKFLVSESGYLLVKTNIVKEAPVCTFVGVNSGFNQLIRPMLYGSYHDIVNVSNPSGPHHTYQVVGNICETDTFATDRLLNEVRVDDILVFKNAGAYGFEMSSNFNSRLRPAEVLIWKGESRIIRTREVFEDLLHNQVEVDI